MKLDPIVIRKKEEKKKNISFLPLPLRSTITNERERLRGNLKLELQISWRKKKDLSPLANARGLGLR